MDNWIRHLEIKNFKSIKNLSLDCERINVFIGKPNAGKSNILEAISLYGAGFNDSSLKFMEGFIRYKSIIQLFTNFQFNTPVEVRANEDYLLRLFSTSNNDQFSLQIYHSEKENNQNTLKAINSEQNPVCKFSFSVEGNHISWGDSNKAKRVKKYSFQPFVKYENKGLFLYPPDGKNFYLMVSTHSELREEIQQFLKPNGLKLLLDEETSSLSIVQETDNSLIRFPLHLVPDTFQRYIFHLAAIMSNQDSVLLFEEPEAHSYPPYVYQLAQYILEDKGVNQYFITTHNPYLLTPLLQEGQKDVALFVTWFENYETRVRRLTEQEIGDILNYGMDVFINLNHFIPNES